MSTAYKCDRCGALYDGRTHRVSYKERFYCPRLLLLIYADGISTEDVRIDLCPDCVNAFDGFINNRAAEPERKGNAE